MSQNETIKLPEPNLVGTMTIEEAILKRRSIRRYKDEPIALAEVSQLLWAAQGITEPQKGLRAAPSAGARYPLELYIVIGNVTDLEPGVYKYIPESHSLVKTWDGDLREDLASACLKQPMVARCAVDFVFAGNYERTTSRYGERGFRYIFTDLGHAAENLQLQAVALGFGTVPVGAFDDDSVAQTLSLPEGEHPIYVIPIGKI